jgi:chromosome segregation ATPase
MKVRELERQITAVRRELACALDDYRELGLQVSLLSKQRNIARQNLARTKQYLQSVQPGLTPQRRDDQAIPISAAANGARPSSRQARATGPVRRSSLHRRVQWRRAVASIASHAVPARQLERELGQLQQQLAASRDECSQLEDYAERLERERDQALADLELARAQALSLANVESAAQTPVEAETPAAEPREVASLGDAFRAAEEKLQREQHAKNDIQIALAEREDQVAALQSERNGLQSEVAQLKVRLSGLQQELSAALQSGQTVLSELRVLRDDSHRTTTQDAERLRALQRRIGEMEARLEAAHGRSEALEQDLATAAARQAETEHQREQLAQALEQERSKRGTGNGQGGKRGAGAAAGNPHQRAGKRPQRRAAHHPGPAAAAGSH